jgi:pectate lyase
MKTQLLTGLSMALLLAACGGSSNKGLPQPGPSSSVNNQSSVPIVSSSAQSVSSAAAVSVGVFVDSFVVGIGYRTETQSGVTNERGEFNYRPGEMVTFFIGDLEFPPIPAKALVTPLDMAQSLDPSSPIAINIARLLQSLDADGNPANGIDLTPVPTNFATPLDFALAPEQFAASPAVVELVANSGSVNTVVISLQQALDHLRETLTFHGVPMEESSSSSSQSSTPVVPGSSASSQSSLSSRSSAGGGVIPPVSSRSSVSSQSSSAVSSAESSSSSSVAGAAPDFETVFGFASLNGGTTGGSGLDAVEVSVCTGAELIAALTNADYSNKPLTIYVDGVITWHNSGKSDIKLNRPNVSIIGRGDSAEFWGTGIHITASNVIVRNLKMYKVPQSRGQGDIITIDGRNGPVRNVWIDHNELFNDLNTPVPPSITDPLEREAYQKDYYDELVSGRSDVADITISYNYLHSSWKTSLWGSSDEDNFDRRITWHHNYWHQVNSRLPLFRFGKGHIYNNYYHSVDTSAINSRMGAIIRVENNVFEQVKNPVMSQDSIAIGFWELIGNQLRDGVTWVEKDGATNIIADRQLADHTSTGTLNLPQGYLYQSSLIPAEDVPAHVQQYAGVGKLDTGAPVLACTRPEWDIEPPPPPSDEPVTETPSSVNWNIFSGDVSPFDTGAVTLADGVSNAAFGLQGSASDFTATGLGSVLFDSTSLGTKNNRARITNVLANDGVYPKYFTMIAGIKGFNPPANARVVELEAAFGDSVGTAASRLKIVLRADGATNYGVQFEGSPAPNTAYGLEMDAYRVYHFTVALSNPTTGWARAYLDGSTTPVINQEEVQMRAASGTADNYLQIGDGGGNAYKALIDWVVWTDEGAYTPAQISGLLPANIGCVKGYGASENLLDCDFTDLGNASSASSSSSSSNSDDGGNNGGGGSSNSSVPSGGGESSASSVSSDDNGASSSASSIAPAFSCSSEPGLYFCDDFSNGSGNWDLLSIPGANGVFDILNDAGDNNVLRHTVAPSGAAGGVLALIKPEALTGVTSADYYVEARIRPRLNTNGQSQRSIYVMARYQDVENWYGMGMVAHENNQPRVEIVERSSSGTAPTSTGGMRHNTSIILGSTGGTDGGWYKLRLELIGTEMKLYLNDLVVASFSDSSLTERGLIGIFSNNRSFEIDDIKVGNANDKPPVPSQLTISPTTAFNAEAGDAPRVITVNAKNTQNADDTFTVVSSDTSVVSVSQNGYEVTLTPVGAGTAVITFTSGSDADLTRTINATIAPAFVMPVATYNLNGLVSPAVNDADAYADTNLTLTFDSPPVLGSAGAIRIFKSSDDSVVDTIKLVDHKDTIGYGTYRTLNTRPISISGNTATIALQSKKLEPNTSYYVAISESVFTGATLATLPFEGIGKNAGWTFTIRAAPAANLTSLTVDDDGNTADFRTLQGALNYVMQHLTKAEPATITLNNGTYSELLYLRNKDNLTITGESREGVVIQYQNSEGFNPGSAGRPVFLVELADMLTLENLTLKNTTIKTSSGGQAETLYFNSTGRLIAKNADFISEQDTLQLKGYSWFYRTLVAGNVDFIWGNNNVSLFEESEIRSLGDSSNANNGGYVVQARTVNAADKGFVFLNSSLTQGAGPVGHTIPVGATYLARSPGGTTTWDNVVFINSKMDSHINPAGWAGAGVNGQPAPNPVVATANNGWREYDTTDSNGDTIELTSRVGGYALQPNEVEAEYCSRAQIFSAYNGGAGWDPLPNDDADCSNYVH